MIDNQKRDQSFDFIKGLLIMLVVLGHAIQFYTNENGWSTHPLFLLIYTFHMPLFIFISGFFSESVKKKALFDVLVEKFRRLIVPLLIYSLVIFLMYMSSSEIEKGSVQNSIYVCFKTYWYLINVFLLTIVYRCICEKDKKVKIILLFAYAMMIAMYDYMPVFILKDCQVLRMIPVFFLGILFKRYKDVVERTVKTHKVIIILFALCAVFIVRFFYGYNLIMYPVTIRIIDGIACSFLAFALMRLAFAFAKPAFLKNFFALVGRNSLVIYLFHVILFKMCLFYKITFDYSLFKIVMMFFLALISSLVWAKLWKKILSPKIYYVLGL